MFNQRPLWLINGHGRQDCRGSSGFIQGEHLYRQTHSAGKSGSISSADMLNYRISRGRPPSPAPCNRPLTHIAPRAL